MHFLRSQGKIVWNFTGHFLEQKGKKDQHGDGLTAEGEQDQLGKSLQGRKKSGRDACVEWTPTPSCLGCPYFLTLKASSKGSWELKSCLTPSSEPAPANVLRKHLNKKVSQGLAGLQFRTHSRKTGVHSRGTHSHRGRRRAAAGGTTQAEDAQSAQGTWMEDCQPSEDKRASPWGSFSLTSAMTRLPETYYILFVYYVGERLSTASRVSLRGQKSPK